jgi:Asp-tRNA(Asn)/Glu-tRNA(Gln) amidotransferase A subunit family amidase
MGHPILDLSACSLVDRMRRGELSAVETVRAFLDRIAALDPKLRAFAYLDPDTALAAAERVDQTRAAGLAPGPLHGLPVAVKDIIDTADMPTEFGAEIFAGRRPDRDAVIVRRLRAAGAIIIGKTVTSQYALLVPGPTQNPHDAAHTPGGSSSGSAAAVAAKLAPVALGTQTNGSIIRPASYCGGVGFKPSLGTLPRTGVLRQATLIDHPGVMARSVSDAALVVDAIAGEDPGDPLSRNSTASMLEAALADGPVPRLAYTLGPFEARAEPATREAFAALIAKLSVRVDAIELGSKFAAAEVTLRDLMCAGVAESLGPDIDSASAEVPELVVQLVQAGRALSGTDVMAAWARRDRLRASLIERISNYDAVLTFAASGPAPLASEGTGDPIFATLWTLIGAPAYSLPLMTGAKGLPVGVQAVAAPGRDRGLTRAAAWLMRAAAQ